MLSNHETDKGENRAVSPVIGVILMVAITVILAAVIGAFVLEIGDQQETAPSTSFDSEEETQVIPRFDGLNFTAVTINHAGGDVLDRQSLTMKVDGNESTYDWHTNPNFADPPKTVLVPSAARLTGESGVLVTKFDTGQGYPYGEEFASGESMTIKSYGGVSYTSLYGCLYDNKGSRRMTIVETGRATDFGKTGYDSRFPNSATCSDEDSNYNWNKMDLLNQEDQITLVWEASSGGKTQTLFKYSVQGR
jgi:flagellin-like protein